MLDIRKIPLWVKGGFISLSVFLLMNFLISPLLEIIRVSSIGHIIAEIITAPFLIISIPLFLSYALIGFLLDMIFNTGVGYESLGVFPLGVIFMQVLNLVYYFLVGVFITLMYGKIKHKKIKY